MVHNNIAEQYAEALEMNMEEFQEQFGGSDSSSSEEEWENAVDRRVANSKV
jgi:hypothetical protein